MKNRTLGKFIKNGKFFCRHNWKIYGQVGRYWDLTLNIKVPARCNKCGKEKQVNNFLIKEIPDHLISDLITYQL